MRRCAADIAQLSDEDFLRLIFVPLYPLNTPSLITSHVHFVASVCHMQRWLLQGCSKASLTLVARSAIRLFVAFHY